LDRDIEPLSDFLTVLRSLLKFLFIQGFGTIPVVSVTDG
jgi:hypothetical protein